MEGKDFDKTLDLTKIKPYGDTMNDGKTQLSFTLPIPCGDEAVEAAKQLIRKMGLENPQVVFYKQLTEGFTFFNCYGSSTHTVDYTQIHVPKVESTVMDMNECDEYIREHIGRLTSRHVIDDLTHRRTEAGHGNGRQLGQPTEHALQATGRGPSVGERTECVAPRRDEDRGATSAEAFEGGEDVGRESPRRGEERPLDVRRQLTERISSQQSDVRAQKKRERIKELIRPLGVGYPDAVAAVGVPKWEGFEVVRHPARGGVGGIVGLADPDGRLVSRIKTV